MRFFRSCTELLCKILICLNSLVFKWVSFMASKLGGFEERWGKLTERILDLLFHF